MVILAPVTLGPRSGGVIRNTDRETRPSTTFTPSSLTSLGFLFIEIDTEIITHYHYRSDHLDDHHRDADALEVLLGRDYGHQLLQGEAVSVTHLLKLSLLFCGLVKGF